MTFWILFVQYECSYFDKYKICLDAIFKHSKDRIKHYELWNELGHKFTAEDIIRIAEITHKDQRKFAPAASSLGYSSPRYGRVGTGGNSDDMPEFINEVQFEGGI